jgi:hypothetical protein
MTGSRGRNTQRRIEIAGMAARILVDDGRMNYSTARRKAADRIGYTGTRDLPDNREIDAALRAYQALFAAPAQAEHLNALRRHAVAAMRLLAPFDPRLAGPVLAGTARTHDPVVLHLFAETLEEVTVFLLDRDIPFELGERRFPGSDKPCPRFRFLAGDVQMELVVFPPQSRHRPPPSEIDGRPMQRATLDQVQALLPDATAAVSRTFTP